jgi:hypothetical protein
MCFVFLGTKLTKRKERKHEGNICKFNKRKTPEPGPRAGIDTKMIVKNLPHHLRGMKESELSHKFGDGQDGSKYKTCLLFKSPHKS